MKRSATFKLPTGLQLGQVPQAKSSNDALLQISQQPHQNTPDVMNLQHLRAQTKKQSSFKIQGSGRGQSGRKLAVEDKKAPTQVPEVVVETDMLLNKQHPKLTDKSDALSAFESFLIVIEKAMTSDTLVLQHQDLVNLQQIFASEPSNRLDQCKYILEYVIELKSKARQLVDLYMANKDYLSKSKPTDSDLHKREELMAKLRAKEQECLDYKSRLDRLQLNIVEQKSYVGLQIPLTEQDVDYTLKINEKQKDFTKCCKFINQIVHDLSNQGKTSTTNNDLMERFEAQVQKLMGIQDSMIEENSTLYKQKLELASRIDSMIKNTKFLEDRLATTMTQKEEQIIKLKSEIVIYKSKLTNYKTKLKDAVNGFETKKLQEYEAQRDKEVAVLTTTIESLKQEVLTLQCQVQELSNTKEQLQHDLQTKEEQYQLQMQEQNLIITELSNRLLEIDKDYTNQLSKVDHIREVTQKRLNLEEKERTMNSLKLEYLINNYRKLEMQKRFLEKSLDKDMKSLAQEMRKAELEMQRDVNIPSNVAKQRLNDMYAIIKESLRCQKEVLGFMNFDVDQVQDNIDPIRSESKIKVQDGVDPITKYERNKNVSRTENVSQIEPQHEDQPTKHTTLEQYFYKNIYEVAEVLLSILNEIYKDAKTQTTIEDIKLFDLLQQKTDKKIVSEIYKKFFARNRIHFAQFLSKQISRADDLHNDKAELQMQVARLSAQIQEIISEHERQQEEDMAQQHQHQQQLQELVEEEIKEHDINNDSSSFSATRSAIGNAFTTQRQSNGSTSGLQNQVLVRDDSGHHSEVSSREQPKPSFNIRDLISQLQQASTSARSSPAAAVASAIFKSQEKRILDMVTAENQALKERVRETRLTLQRQVYELQQLLNTEKELHQTEINRVKIEFGRDLAALNKSQKQKEYEMLKQLEQQQQAEIDAVTTHGQLKLNEALKEFQDKLSELELQLQSSNKKREELERELHKIKKESNNVALGGWGTFAIVFEESHKKNPLIAQLTSTLMASYQVAPQTPKSPMDGVKDMIVKKLLRQSSNADTFESSVADAQDGETSVKEEIPLEKLQHFIEVGFLMDSKSFKFRNAYREKTYDSSLIKYLFEFQEPIDNYKMTQLQNKIKQQLTDNFALFNEINPVYITLNLGRTVSNCWGDDSLSQEHFRLIKREGYYLNGDRYIMVNFLKCDEPQYVMRIVAFDNDKCQQYSLDLTFEDLMILVDGNMKLLDDDHANDLCQIILNNLTFIKKKESKVKTVSDQDKDRRESVDTLDESQDHATVSVSATSLLLALRAKTKDKKPAEQGVKGCLAVEHKLFFNEHYRTEYDQRNRVILAKHDKRKKGLIQEKSVSTDFEQSMMYEALEIVYQEKGEIGNTIPFDLTLLRGKMSGNMVLRLTIDTLTQELILHSLKTGQSHQSTSEIIRVPNSQSLAYVIAFEKLFNSESYLATITQLTKYDEQQMTQYQWDPLQQHQKGSLAYNQSKFYLVKKSDRLFMRVTDYEILNTEVRSLLFMHSYGYNQALVDFGKLKGITGITIKDPLDHPNMTNCTLIFRDFGIVRIKRMIERRLKSDHEDLEDSEQEDFKYENSYAIFAFYDENGSAKQGEVTLYLKVYNQNIEVRQRVSLSEVLDQSKIDQFDQDVERICKKAFDFAIVQEGLNGQYEIVLDKSMQSMREIIEQLKIQKYQAMFDEEYVLKPEIDAKTLGLTLNFLAECPKLTYITMINRKVFKITAYFVSNIKSIKPQTFAQTLFDWQLIYIDANHRQQGKSYTISINEKDLKEIIAKLNDQLKGSDVTFDEKSVINSKATQETLLNFILDGIVIDETKSLLKISISHLKARILDRQLLQDYFLQSGSRFISKLGQMENPENALFRTSLAQIDLSRKLIVTAEKEFADKKYDIKIYELSLKQAKTAKKYQFEMFCIDNPNAVIRIDYHCSDTLNGSKTMIERFNIIQQMHQDYEENKFIRDGMVLVINEQSFPHSLHFLVLEPSSHIQWDFVVNDNELRPIQSRGEREAFLKLIRDKLEMGLIGWNQGFDKVKEFYALGYQKEMIQQEQVDLWQGNLQSALNSEDPLLYSKNIQITMDDQKSVFAEFSISSDRRFNSITLQFSLFDVIQKASLMIKSLRQSSKLLSGFFRVNDHQSVIYTIETSCAYTHQERALRITLHDPSHSEYLLDVILASKTLLNFSETQTLTVRDELKFAFNTGFKDSFSAYQKLPGIQEDFKKSFVQNEKVSELKQEQDTSKLVYRKVVNFEGKALIIFVRYDSIDVAEKEWKVVLYDQATSQEETFTFQTAQILNQDELNSLNARNDRIMKDLVMRVVDKRLRIRVIEEDKFQVVKLSSNDKEGVRYYVYFVDPPLGSAAGVKNPFSHGFDIRQGFRYHLADSDSPLPEVCDTQEQERLLVKLEKGDLSFDVSEILNPFELIMRFKIYEGDSLKMLSVSDIKEFEVRRELMKDQVSYLIEPQRRLELAQYLVQNTYYDSVKRRVFFLKSHNE